LTWMLIGFLSVSSAGAWPRGVDHAIFSDVPGSPGGEKDPRLGEPGTPDDEGGKASRASRIIGVSLLGSGIFLCSWGIAAWEMEEYQCCPAHNTGNVLKIVAGVVLLNAGLIYLLEAEG
jgi:hypothetical protein